MEKVGIRVKLIDDFEAEAANLDSSKQPLDELRMPQRVNLHKLGRHCSKSIAENNIRSAKQDDDYGASNIVLPCPKS